MLIPPSTNPLVQAVIPYRKCKFWSKEHTYCRWGFLIRLDYKRLSDERPNWLAQTKSSNRNGLLDNGNAAWKYPKDGLMITYTPDGRKMRWNVWIFQNSLVVVQNSAWQQRHKEWVSLQQTLMMVIWCPDGRCIKQAPNLSSKHEKLCQSELLSTFYLCLVSEVMKRVASIAAFSLVASAVQAQEICERTNVAVLYVHTLGPRVYTFGTNQDWQYPEAQVLLESQLRWVCLI